MDKVYVVILTFDNNETYEDHIYYDNDFQGVFSSVKKAENYIHSCYSEKEKIYNSSKLGISPLTICVGPEDTVKRYKFYTTDQWGNVADYYYDIKEVTIDKGVEE